jgi:hypothetical protein
MLAEPCPPVATAGSLSLDLSFELALTALPLCC